MRDLINIIDSISEATITKYGPGKKFQIGDSETGKQLAGQLNAQGVNPAGPMELLDVAQVDVSQADALIGKPIAGKPMYAFKTQQGKVWIYSGGNSTISSALIHFTGTTTDGDSDTKLSNRGEIAEGLLGAAMFAKFTKREAGEELGVVTVQDVVGVLDRLKNVGEDLYQLVVKDADNQHADTVTFLLALKTGPYQDLMNPAKRGALANEYASAVGYVNSPMADRYSKYFYLNGKADEIAVIADGAASETERKTDVWVAVKDEQGKMRRLKLNASLKVGGVAQFGQVGGDNSESMIKLWSYFGIDVTDYVELYEKKAQKDRMAALEFMYKHVADVLAKQLEGDDNNAEARFVDNIAHAVTFFATLGDPAVELVDFSKGGFKILRFRNLVEKMRNIDLTATYLSHKARPEIIIHDVKNPKNVLIGIRTKVENKPNGIYVRNIIEKGHFLEEITKVQQRAWDELEKSEVEKTKLELRPRGVKKSDNKEPADIGRKRRA